MIITFYKHYIDKKGTPRVEVGVEDHAKLIEWFIKRYVGESGIDVYTGVAQTILEKFFDSLNDYEKVKAN